jgi:hypothetical protein
MILCGAVVGACSESDEPTQSSDGAVQPGVGGIGAFDAGGGPGAGAWNDAGPRPDGGSGGIGGSTAGGATAGSLTGGGTLAGGFTAGGIIAGGFTAGGFISGGFTAGGFISGGFTAGARDAGAGTGIDASVPSDAGAPVGDGSDQFAAERQLCVDTINMYRAKIGVAPVARANAAQEACSDRGAKYDGDMNVGHASTHVPGAGPNGSAGPLCGSVGLLGVQDACPGWPVGSGWGAYATVGAALTKCLDQMWAEGEPPGGVAACKQQFFTGNTACFEKYGHYINMSDASNTAVSCGFYKMSDGRYWMNQDFVSR